MDKLIIGLGSIPSIATVVTYVIDCVMSGLVYDFLCNYNERAEIMMKKLFFVIGLGCCGNEMVTLGKTPNHHNYEFDKAAAVEGT